MSEEYDPSERSPLLSNGQKAHHAIPRNNKHTVADEAHGSHDEEEGQNNHLSQHEDLKKIKLRYIFPALSIGVFLSAADQTIIISSYGKIGSDLKALSSTSWVATAYFLTLTSFQPLYGKLSDIFGRRAALLSAYLIFGIGCLFCGMARNIGELVAARAFAGIGGGGMTTVVSILLSDVVPLRQRGTWQGYINIIYASGSACGAPLGGLFADYLGWRWAFISQTPLTLAAFVGVFFTLHQPELEKTGWKAKLRRIDFTGAFVLVAAVSTLLIAFDRGSNISWSSSVTLIPLCVAIPLFALFLYIEMRVATEPFAPGHLIFERTLFSCYLCNFFSFGGWLAAIFYIPLYFQVIDDISATRAGLCLLPGIFGGVTGSLFAGVTMQKTGKYYWLTVVAYSLLPVGMLQLFLFTGLISHSLVAISVGISISGFGHGIGVTSTLIALIANTTPETQAIATACSYLFRTLGSMLGVSLASTVFQQSLRTNLNQNLNGGKDVEEIVRHVKASLDYIKTLNPEVKSIVIDCYQHSITWTFLFCVIIATGAMISAWWIKEKPLSK